MRPRRAPRPPLLLALLLPLLLVACSSAEPPDAIVDQPAATLATNPSYLSFDGTSSASVEVTADGTWELETNQDWISASSTSGTGDETITLTIDRTGLTPAHYAGSVLFKGAEPEATVTVSMRFPTVDGNVSETGGQVSPMSAPPSTSEPEQPYSPGEVLVLLNDDMARVLATGKPGLQPQTLELSRSQFDSMATGLAADLGMLSEGVTTTVLPVTIMRTEGSVQEEIEKLLLDGRVAHAQPNYLYQVPQVEAQRLEPQEAPFDLQWHYENINMRGAWQLTSGSPDVTVAVIDTGFAIQHPDLSPNLLDGFDFGTDDPDEDAAEEVCWMHGTHVAGTVAGVANPTVGASGVAPGIRILPLKTGVYDAVNEKCPMPTYGIVLAILYAAGFQDELAGRTDKVDVINMSLGMGSYDFLQAEAISLALGQGVSVIAAAGNSGTSPVMYPAGHAGVIGVSASGYDDTITDYSNYGPKVDVSAPGGDMTVDLNSDGYVDGVWSLGKNPANGQFDYLLLQGTSMASPHVAGVAALMRSVNRELSPSHVISALQNTAIDHGTPGFDNAYGHGLIDAGAAIQLAQDVLTARFPEVVVRLSEGGDVIAQVNSGNDGSYVFPNIAQGTYLLEAGTDVDSDGVLGEGGEFYASDTVVVSYSGDTAANLELDPN